MTAPSVSRESQLSAREVSAQERRDALADAAIATLAELGYARTSLREIAERTSLSHGSIHYFFAGKNDLICAAVRRYKEQCAHRYDVVVDASTSAAQLRDGFAAALAVTMVEDGPLHRLWYDIRAQAMFDPALRSDVQLIDERLERMIDRVVRSYGTFLDAEGQRPCATPSSLVAYTSFDGLFEHCLLRHLSGDADAVAMLTRDAADLLDRLFGKATS